MTQRKKKPTTEDPHKVAIVRLETSIDELDESAERWDEGRRVAEEQAADCREKADVARRQIRQLQKAVAVARGQADAVDRAVREEREEPEAEPDPGPGPMPPLDPIPAEPAPADPEPEPEADVPTMDEIREVLRQAEQPGTPFKRGSLARQAVEMLVRREPGLTGPELGDRLGGWTQAKVSTCLVRLEKEGKVRLERDGRAKRAYPIGAEADEGKAPAADEPRGAVRGVEMMGGSGRETTTRTLREPRAPTDEEREERQDEIQDLKKRIVAFVTDSPGQTSDVVAVEIGEPADRVWEMVENLIRGRQGRLGGLRKEGEGRMGRLYPRGEPLGGSNGNGPKTKLERRLYDALPGTVAAAALEAGVGAVPARQVLEGLVRRGCVSAVVLPDEEGGGRLYKRVGE